jgi:hypothetical protein
LGGRAFLLSLYFFHFAPESEDTSSSSIDVSLFHTPFNSDYEPDREKTIELLRQDEYQNMHAVMLEFYQNHTWDKSGLLSLQTLPSPPPWRPAASIRLPFFSS